MTSFSSSKKGHIRQTAYVSVLILGGILSPIALGLGMYLRHRAASSPDNSGSWQGIWAFALLGTLVYGVLIWWVHLPLALLLALWQSLHGGNLFAGLQFLLLLWLSHGVFAPLIALSLEGLVKSTRTIQLAPRPILSSPRRRTKSQQSRREDGRFPTIPEVIDGHGVIGWALSGTLWQWVKDNAFVYPRYVMPYHAVALAQSGMGKSELLRRIAYTAAKHGGMKVLWIDGKGDWQDASRFELTMKRAGCAHVGIFPIEAHAGWRGARQDVLNLLMATQIFEKDYYRGVTYNILKLALYAPGLSLVESGAELLRRLYPPTLMTLYQSSAELLYLEALTTDALWGPYNKYQAFFNGVQDRLDGSRGYGDFDAAYYLLDEKRLQEGQLAPFARYLIDDFYLYLALRRQKGKERPILLVLDDFSAYSSMVAVHKLYERVRSAHGCVILSAQGYEGLGEDAERLLEDAATTILGKCNLPEKLVRVAGNKKIPSFAYQLPTAQDSHGLRGGQEESSHLVMREEERSLVEPDEVRGLAIGEAFFLYGSAAHKIRVERVSLDADQVKQRANELLALYAGMQEEYEAKQAVVRGQVSLPANAKGQMQGKRRRRKHKPPPPVPPQPEELADGKKSGPSLTSFPSRPSGEPDVHSGQRDGSPSDGGAGREQEQAKPLSLDDIE